ncbi:hypothetical protein OH76DRAFT_317255 [Lentinus brumalis]|uniref:DUF6533 domain-containing protein n=1 Tax=Lentinus brumalis TaxID=2498619 RepID=A0A371DFE9_9APHY|nr:hypothetical protein OH76DRAFT_317255 [Polyporus brumalis]
MSSSDADAIASYETIIVNNYCVVAASVFLLYEYVITIDREVNSFWHRAPTGASILFMSNRYLSFVGNVLGLIEFKQWSDELRVGSKRTCRTDIHELPPMGGFLWYAGLCPLQRHHPLDTRIPPCSCPPSNQRGSVLLRPDRSKRSPVGVFRGGLDSLFTTTEVLVIISRACLIVSDALIIGLTWWALPKHTVSFATLRKTRVSLTTVLLRDGSLYFGVLLIMNVLHLAFSLTSMFGFADNGASNVTAFTEVVAVPPQLTGSEQGGHQGHDLDGPALHSRGGKNNQFCALHRIYRRVHWSWGVGLGYLEQDSRHG